MTYHGAHCYDNGTLICGWPEQHKDKTMRELVEEYERKNGPIGTFDYALPQAWWDDYNNLMGFPPHHIVWHYPTSGYGHVWGKPLGLTEYARYCLAEYTLYLALRVEG